MRVLVLGAGVIGLTCAVRLAEDGWDVHVLARDLPQETTSAVAAALWYPYRAYPYDQVTDWARTSYAEFARLAEEEVADCGVSMVDGSQLLREPSPDPWWSDAVPRLVRLATPPGGYRDGWTFRAPVIEMPLYLDWLRQRVEALGGTLVRMSVAAMPNHAPRVVNATGLGGRLLAADAALSPVRGQVVYVEQFGLRQWWLDADGPTYIVPRSEDIVIGGTDEEGDWNLAPDPDLAEQLLERAARIVPEIARTPVIGHRVGLRPARPQVCLEQVQNAEGSRIIHCYGHGGAGVTLSWGCAADVVKLMRDQNSRPLGSSIPRSSS